MRFRLEADFVFDANDLADAHRRLAAHFLRSSFAEDAELAQHGPQGYIVIVPADDEPSADA